MRVKTKQFFAQMAPLSRRTLPGIVMGMEVGSSARAIGLSCVQMTIAVQHLAGATVVAVSNLVDENHDPRRG